MALLDLEAVLHPGSNALLILSAKEIEGTYEIVIDGKK